MLVGVCVCVKQLAAAGRHRVKRAKAWVCGVTNNMKIDDSHG